MTVGPRDGASARRDARTAGTLVCLALVACSAPPAVPAPQDGPPATASVRDGIGVDLDTQEARSALFANWDAFVDPEGGPVVYEWSVGTSPGGTDVMSWTPTGGTTRVATSGVDLPVGVTLHVNVRASDLAGNRSGIATSDGIVIGQPVENRFDFSPRETAPAPAPAGALAAVERFGVTWTFDRPMPCGRFVNGDWWVVGPVDVVAISPASQADGERVRHGSMIDPDPRALLQGYDSGMFGADSGHRYDASKNVALGISRQKPLRLAPGTTLVSATSHAQAGQMPQLESCSVLTCLAEPAPADAFRPPYCGKDKTCRWSAASLDLSRLARLAAVPGAPPIADLLERFERTWLDHIPGWTSRFLHPRENMPDYGRDIADLVGQAALVLQLDLPDADKRKLAVAMVQVGIDLFGILENGGRFYADGGSGSGRKLPVLLAGALLRDEAILKRVRETAGFAEDVQTFYVAETAPGVWNHGHGGYGPEDVGLPEWGVRHGDDASHDRKPWTADPYRRCCTANVWVGSVLASRVMGLREAWGHEALFDYMDRYMQIEPRGEWTRSWSPFAERMWDRYRGDY